MSIDSRLRDGLAAEVVEVSPDWSDVLDRAARADSRDRTVRRAGLVLAAAAAVALVLVLLMRPDTDDLEPAPPPPSPTSSVPEPHPIEGSWTSGRRPASQIAAQLESEGLGEWMPSVFDGLSVPRTYAVDMRLSGGHLTTTEWRDGESQGVVDVESYLVSGQTVTFTPEGGNDGCRSAFRWQVTDDVLRLRYTSSRCPAFGSAREAAYQNKLYAAAPFRRVTE